MEKIVIAIDGFSSTGKSTVAKQLAKALNYVYVDTGAMYRAVALFAMRKGFISDGKFNKKELVQNLDAIDLRFHFNPDLGFAEMFLNGENVEKDIRTLDVSRFVSQIAEIHEVRVLLVQQQQILGKGKGIVMDGRDIGTVVFPEAELKLFMTASAKTRAQRRFDELQNRGEPVSYDAVLKNIQQRDQIDSTRKDSPLRKAADAIEIDNSALTHQEQFDKIVALAEKRIALS